MAKAECHRRHHFQRAMKDPPGGTEHLAVLVGDYASEDGGHRPAGRGDINIVETMLLSEPADAGVTKFQRERTVQGCGPGCARGRSHPDPFFVTCPGRPGR
jgi:hypothetical protein